MWRRNHYRRKCTAGELINIEIIPIIADLKTLDSGEFLLKPFLLFNTMTTPGAKVLVDKIGSW